MAAIPAGQVEGVTALAVTVIVGVATELPSAGAVMVMIPFDLEAKMYELSSIVRTIDFMVILLSLVFEVGRRYFDMLPPWTNHLRLGLPGKRFLGSGPNRSTTFNHQFCRYRIWLLSRGAYLRGRCNTEENHRNCDTKIGLVKTSIFVDF
jgi:hypothetical protein